MVITFLYVYNVQSCKETDFEIYLTIFFPCRIQAGQYKESLELLEELRKIEEEQMGGRTEKMAEIYQLMSKTKSEVFHFIVCYYGRKPKLK